MSDVAQACADLAAWLPYVRVLRAQPDADGTASHGKPGSRPPWNAAAENCWFDVHAGVRDLEADLRYRVSGTVRHRGGSDANTLAALRAVAALAAAVDAALAEEATRQVARWLTAILQLPAVDLEERPQRVRAACPYCGVPMLRVLPRSGRVTCLRRGACVDGDGRHPVGEIGRSSLDGTPRIMWADGLVT